MITREELDEIKNNDFLDKRNHFSQHNDVKSEKILGNFYEESPLVTIVMPIYNHPAPYFERALKSAIEQKGFSDYQILIVDNDAEAKNGNEQIVLKQGRVLSERKKHRPVWQLEQSMSFGTE